MQTIETLLESCTVCGGESDGKMCPECHRPVCVDCWSVEHNMCVLCLPRVSERRYRRDLRRRVALRERA
jgi:hypothetical protein